MPRSAWFGFMLTVIALVASARPASAGVTGVIASNNPVAGQTAYLTVTGTGTCAVDVQIGTTPLQTATLSGPLPLTEKITIATYGTYSVQVRAHVPGDPCAPPTVGSITVLPGYITEIGLSEPTAGLGDDVAVTVYGSGTCTFEVYANPSWPAVPVPNLSFNAKTLPFTFHTVFTMAGTYKTFVTPSFVPGSSGNCGNPGAQYLTTPLSVVATRPAPAAVPTAAPGTTTGTITGLTASATHVYQGETVLFTVDGTGSCSILLSGLSGAPKTQSPQPMPLKIPVTMSSSGTFTAGVVALGLAGAPGNCNTTLVNQQIVVMPAPPPQASIQRMTIAPTTAGAWRPDASILYTREPFTVSVVGSAQNAAPDATNRCMYEISITALDTPSHGIFDVANEPAFGDKSYPGLAPGLYRVDARPPAVNYGFSVPECVGGVTSKVRVLDPKGWITGMDVVGFAFHFNAHDDMAMPQFCDACTSIFSPAHNRSFLGINPHTNGETSSGSCAYHITAARGSDVRGGEGTFINGQPGAPRAQRALSFNPNGAIGVPNAPFWYMYDDNSDTVAVTIGESQQSPSSSCYIVGGKIQTTITFTQNLNLPPVRVTVDAKP